MYDSGEVTQKCLAQISTAIGLSLIIAFPTQRFDIDTHSIDSPQVTSRLEAFIFPNIVTPWSVNSLSS